MSNEQMKENKMGIMPMDKLLLSMSLPIMISMLVQALYNIVDSIFVANINEYALRAVSLAFPIQSLMIAVSVGTAVGINSLMARSLGEKDNDKANKVAENGIFLEVLSCIVFILVGIFVSVPFYRSQTDIVQVREYGVEYMTICCTLCAGLFTQITFERILQSTGKSFLTMITQGIGAIVNIILDPIFIFGLFGLPKMGVSGAAVATVIGQTTGAVLGVLFHHKYNKEIRISFKGFRPNITYIGNIYAVGLPSIVMQAIGSVMTYGMNLILAAFGVAQTVFGIYFKLQSFIFMPIFGLNNGMVPIVAFNYGAKKKERVVHAIKSSVKYACVIMAAGFLAMQFFPAQLMGMFNPTPELIEVGAPALRVISISFLFAGYCIVIGSVFQALGNGVYSMIVSVARQLIVLLPAAYLLSLSGNVHAIWWAFPIAEIVSVAMTTFFLIRVNKKIISKI